MMLSLGLTSFCFHFLHLTENDDLLIFFVVFCVFIFFCWNERHFNGIEYKVHKFKWTTKSQKKTDKKITKLNFTFIDLRHLFNSKKRHTIVKKKKAQMRRLNFVPELIYWTRSYLGIESKFISCAIRAHRHYFWF